MGSSLFFAYLFFGELFTLKIAVVMLKLARSNRVGSDDQLVVSSESGGLSSCVDNPEILNSETGWSLRLAQVSF